LDPDLNPDPELITGPDPNLQIVSDLAGSGCTTLVPINLLVSANIGNDSQCFHKSVFFFFVKSMLLVP
jgi:hypothetical protein